MNECQLNMNFLVCSHMRQIVVYVFFFFVSWFWCCSCVDVESFHGCVHAQVLTTVRKAFNNGHMDA